MKHGAWFRSSFKGDDHVERTIIEKKIFKPSLKQRQRQRWKILPKYTTASEKAEDKTTHGVLNVVTLDRREMR